MFTCAQRHHYDRHDRQGVDLGALVHLRREVGPADIICAPSSFHHHMKNVKRRKNQAQTFSPEFAWIPHWLFPVIFGSAWSPASTPRALKDNGPSVRLLHSPHAAATPYIGRNGTALGLRPVQGAETNRQIIKQTKRVQTTDPSRTFFCHVVCRPEGFHSAAVWLHQLTHPQ